MHMISDGFWERERLYAISQIVSRRFFVGRFTQFHLRQTNAVARLSFVAEIPGKTAFSRDVITERQFHL